MFGSLKMAAFLRLETLRHYGARCDFEKEDVYKRQVFVCYTTEVASHAHLLRVQKYTRSEIPVDGALRWEAGSPGK